MEQYPHYPILSLRFMPHTNILKYQVFMLQKYLFPDNRYYYTIFSVTSLSERNNNHIFAI